MQTRVVLVGLFAGLFAGIPFLPFASIDEQFLPWLVLSQMPVLVAGFVAGVPAAALAASIAIAIILSFQDPVMALGFVVMFGLPSLLAARVAWIRPPVLTGHALLYIWSFYAFFLLLVLLDNVVAGGPLQPSLYERILPALNEIRGTGNIADNEKMAFEMSHVLPAGVAVLALLFCLLNTIVAQVFVNNLRLLPRPPLRLSDLVLPRGTSSVLGALFVLGLFWTTPALKYLAVNLLIFGLFLYVLQGLAVLHAVFRKHAQRGIILLALYVLLVVSGTFPLMAALGLAEEWFKLRRKLLAQQS